MSRVASHGRRNRLEWVGRGLVTLQFGLLALLCWRAWDALSAWHAWTTAGLAAAASLGLWALTANRPGNFNIRPTPRHDGELVTGGPYRWVRHPMYTAVLLAAAALASVSHQFIDALIWSGLLGVLLAKASIEERALLVRFPAYQGYRSHTKRFLPGLL